MSDIKISKHTRTRLPEGTAQVRNASTGEVKEVGDIKMEDGSILNVPYGATHLLGDYFAKWIDNNSVSIIGNYQGATWQDTARAMPRNAIDLSEVSLLREKQKLTSRVTELEGALRELSGCSSVINSDACTEIINKALKESE